jgi:hypothetical protein
MYILKNLKPPYNTYKPDNEWRSYQQEIMPKKHENPTN